MKRDLKINFFMLDEIAREINKYKVALDDMEKSASNMLRMLRQNTSMAIKELEDKYNSFIAELKKCYSELEDMYKILTSYSEEMQAIIRPINRTAFMRVDRNDIYMNMRTIISAEAAVTTLAYTRGNIGFSNLASFTKSDDEKQREEENYRKLERIWQEVIPRYARKLGTQVDALNNIYTKKIIPFENKDDEFKSKAKKLGDKYTSTWETIKKGFQNLFENGGALLKGFAIALKDLVVGIYELAKGIVCYAAAGVVLVELQTNDELPQLKEDKWKVDMRKWAEDTFNGTNNTIATILKDPSLIVEGLSQGISDAYEEEGGFYCAGYAIGSIIGVKGIDKLSKAAKLKYAGSAEAVLESPADEILNKVGGAGIGAEAGANAISNIKNVIATKVSDLTKYVKNITKIGEEFELETAEGLRFRLRRDEIPAGSLDEVDGIADDIAEATQISTGGFTKFTCKGEAEAWADEAFSSWEKGITTSERQGIYDYTTDEFYQNINNVLRGLETEYAPGNATRVEEITSALGKASVPEPITVYRGVGRSALGDLQGLSPEQLVGHMIEDDAFMSTSLVPEGAFSKPVTYIIKVPQGAEAAFIGDISYYGSKEVELLLNRGQQMIIQEATEDALGNLKLVCELLP